MKKYFVFLVASFCLTSLVGTPQSHAADEECKSGNAKACFRLGKEALKKNDVTRGLDLMDKGCSYDDARSCLRLGTLYERQRDLEKAKEFYSKACRINKEVPCKNALAISK